MAKGSSKRSLTDIQKEINNTYGDNAITQGFDNVLDRPRIPTGVRALDKILGGGLPRGHMAEFFGPEMSGKSSISVHFMAEAQKVGEVALIDLENSFDPVRAEAIGVDVSRILVTQPESAEAALDILDMLLDSDEIAAVVIDSVAGLTPRAEIEGDFGDSHVGLQARLMSQATRKLMGKMRSTQSQAVILWINQIREKIGSMVYGPQTTTTGGRALKFWCDTRVEVVRTGAVKQGEDVIGHTVKVKTAKNRYAPPFQTATFEILYDSGISNEGTILDEAIDAGIIKKSGAWFAHVSTGENIGQGRPNVLRRLKEDRELFEEIVGTLKE